MVYSELPAGCGQRDAHLPTDRAILVGGRDTFISGFLPGKSSQCPAPQGRARRVSLFRSVTLAATGRNLRGIRLGDDRSVFLLRLIIPDRPGSLGTVATALGEVNADIHAIEIVEHRRENGTAVDDIVVDLPPGVLPDRLVSACNSVDDVEVIWFSRYGAGGGLHMDLEAVEQMTSAPAEAVDILVEQAPAVLHADWAALLDGTGSQIKVALETSATPEFGDLGDQWLPLEKATTLTAPDHKGLSESVLVAAPLESDRRVLVIGRRGGPEFLGSEVARLSYLASLAVTIRVGGTLFFMLGSVVLEVPERPHRGDQQQDDRSDQRDDHHRLGVAAVTLRQVELGRPPRAAPVHPTL